MGDEVRRGSGPGWQQTAGETVNGDCSLCRRKRYCSKPCKPQRMRKAYILQLMEQSRKEREQKDDV